MSEKRFTRRKFMAISSAAVAAPALLSMAGSVPEAKAETKSYNFVEKKECDLVVLGGGGSGLIAAVRAAQLSGKKVIVLEKANFIGGGMRSARTIRTFRSKWQQKRNLPDHFTQYAQLKMDYALWMLDPKVVENCMLGTGQFFDWLCEIKGADFENQFTEGKYTMADSEYEPIGPQVEDTGMNGKTFGGIVVSTMQERAKALGVDILTKHPVVDVEVKDGKIVAAIAKSEKGYVRIGCKACVMSIGSWIMNDEIVKKYVPDYYANKWDTVMGEREKAIGQSQAGHTNANYTGDGIPIAEKAGAFIDYSSFCIRLLGPMAIGMGGTAGTMAESPYVITVNLNGRRYCCEPITRLGSIDSAHLQVAQPHARGLSIFDRNVLQAALDAQKNTPAAQGETKQMPGMPMMAMGLSGSVDDIIASLKKGGGQSGPPQGAPGSSGGGAPGSGQGAPGGQGGQGGAPGGQGGAPAGMTAAASGSGIQSGAPQGGSTSGGQMGGSSLPSSYWADTLEELADKMGVDKKAFLETIKKYNEYCEKGSDMDMFKDKKYLIPINKGPFFAATSTYNHDGAFGGVKVNADMQAYKADRKSLVEGLYVTGDFATGRHCAFNGHKRQAINDLSWAVSSGFLAGNSAAEYLKKV
jgi:succinate dehydrogenase/fumarate reductase flavoprotein subunit